MLAKYQNFSSHNAIVAWHYVANVSDLCRRAKSPKIHKNLFLRSRSSRSLNSAAIESQCTTFY